MLFGRAAYNATLVSTLLAAFCVAIPVSAAAEERATIAPSAEEIKPLGTGDRAPRFTVRTVEDEPFAFDPDALERPAIFITFRGGWCPYCNMHLSELRTVIPDIRQMGVDVYFLSGDRPELLYSTLQSDTQADIDGLDYVILSDAGMNAAFAFGTAFRAAESTIARRLERGQDIAGSSMDRHHALAVPAVYLVDTDGLIRFSFVEPDYRVRLSADALLEAAKDISR